MATTITRRPLPALLSLVALLVLAAIVWWRVLSRDSGSSHSAAPTPTHTACTTPAAPTRTLAPPAASTVEVLNSTDRAGIAGKARTSLIADGFRVPQKAGNDKPSVSIPSSAEIRYGPAGVETATLLHYYFPGSRMVHEKTKSAAVVVSLGDKYSAVATPAAVRAALARDRIALQPGSGPSSPAASPTPTGSTSPSSATSSTSPAC